MDWALFSVMLLSAMISGTLTRWSIRGGIQLDYSPFRSISQVLGFVALIAGIVWGFINIPWYFVIALLLLASFIAAKILNPRSGSFLFFAHLKPALDIVTVGSSCGLWFFPWG